MRKLAATFAAVFALAVPVAGPAFGASPHDGATGQPNQSCEDQTTRPGDAITAPGSAFNPDGVAGKVYADSAARRLGTGPGLSPATYGASTNARSRSSAAAGGVPKQPRTREASM